MNKSISNAWLKQKQIIPAGYNVMENIWKIFIVLYIYALSYSNIWFLLRNGKQAIATNANTNEQKLTSAPMK